MTRLRSARRAFTLIELLVVIAIIALLVSILLPALASSRALAKQSKCQQNMHQIAIAFSNYGNDNKDQIWEAGNATQNPFRFWYVSPLDGTRPVTPTNPYILGPLYRYATKTDLMMECPTNQRKTRTKAVTNASDPQWQNPQNQLQLALFNEFLTDKAMNFDYTMVTGASGAAFYSNTMYAWDPGCKNKGAQAARATVLGATTAAPLIRFPSLPVFIEEDDYWWNSQSPDGLFSNWDELSTRHSKGSHIVYLGGSVEYFKSPKGPDPDSQNDLGSLAGNDFYASARGVNWYQLCPTWPGVPRPYGWSKNPKP